MDTLKSSQNVSKMTGSKEKMIASDIDTYQSQITTNNIHAVPNLISSTPINRVTTHAESVAIQALPVPLAAPPGWRSEIIHSNSPPLTNEERRQMETSTSFRNSYQEDNTNASGFKRYQAEQVSSGYVGNSNEYANRSIDGHVSFAENDAVAQNALVLRNRSIGNNALVTTNTFHDDRTILTERQQQDIIHRVEHQNPPPLIVRKTLPNNTVTYRQNVSVRYLQPPTPPPPGPLIIREVHPPPPPPRSPIKIQQRAPALPTPPPVVLRERPPLPPPSQEPKIVEKLLPPLPQGPRRVIVERYGPCPPKPADVIIERWLPYKQSGERRVLVERAPAPCIPQQEPNLLILHDGPRACVRKEFINQGVVRADPECYLRQYGGELDRWQSNSQHAHLVSEASRAVPPPFGSSSLSSSNNYYRENDYNYCSDRYERARSPCIESNTWERVRAPSPNPCRSSYNYTSSCCEPAVNYCRELSSDCDYGHRRSYDDCYIREEKCLTTTDITPSWNRYCRSSSYDCYPSSYTTSSMNPSRTIRVCSDDEFRRVLCDLTNGHVPSGLQSC